MDHLKSEAFIISVVAPIRTHAAQKSKLKSYRSQSICTFIRLMFSAWDSTWHLPLELQEPVLQKICEGLTDHGIFIFTTGGLDGPHEKSDSSMGIEVGFGGL